MLDFMKLLWRSCIALAFHSDDPGSISEIVKASFLVK
jgi:hypothetical protein